MVKSSNNQKLLAMGKVIQIGDGKCWLLCSGISVGPCCGTCSGPMLWVLAGTGGYWSGRGQGIGRSAEGGHEPTKPSIKHPSTKGAAILGRCRKELLQASIDERNCNFGMCRKELPQASIGERICNFGMCRKVLLQAPIDERSCNFWHL